MAAYRYWRIAATSQGAGGGTTFEVLELQKKLTEAEAAVLRAEADYNKAIGEYHRQTGTSLRVQNVNLN